MDGGSDEFIAIAPVGARLDAWLATWLPGVDRIDAGKLVREGRVQVEPACPIRPSSRLLGGERVTVQLPPPREAAARPEPLPLAIPYQDDDLVVIHKPAGMPSHPGPGWWSGTAVNALLSHVPRWRPIGGIATPGIVHRLDRDTAGLMVYANGEEAHRTLLAAMHDRAIARTYLAVARGRLEGSGVLDGPLARDPANPERVIVTPDGRRAVTRWRALASIGADTLVSLALETGRTHQIRVHLAHAGHPVIGDPWYGEAADGLRLFAQHLAFKHPRTGIPLKFYAAPGWLDGGSGDLLNPH